MESVMSVIPDPYDKEIPMPRRGEIDQDRALSIEEAVCAAARTAAGRIAEASQAATNGSGELAGKLDKTGGLASQAVRDAYKETAEQVEKALEELKALVEKIEKEADEFINTLLDTGAYHADRIDTATQNLKTLLAWMGNQRNLISKEILPPLPPPTVANVVKKSVDVSY